MPGCYRKILQRTQRISSSGAAVDEVVCRTVIIAGLHENKKIVIVKQQDIYLLALTHYASVKYNKVR